MYGLFLFHVVIGEWVCLVVSLPSVLSLNSADLLNTCLALFTHSLNSMKPEKMPCNYSTLDVNPRTEY